ncbi:hypothetical protein QUA86_32060 [Microcoleus sp. F6_B6]
MSNLLLFSFALALVLLRATGHFLIPPIGSATEYAIAFGVANSLAVESTDFTG